jgi:PAS domain S-box-containing protein
MTSFQYSAMEKGKNSVQESSLRSLLDNTSDAVSRFNRQMRHVYANAATARANQRPVEDFYGKTMRELGHSEEISELIESNLRAVFASGEERTIDVEFAGPGGKRYFQTRMSPERDAHGAVEHVIVISRDLTTERAALEKLIKSERYGVANRLAHELAHQLNNPLQALRNTVYLLQQEIPEEARAGHLQSADRLLQRIETMLQTILLLREEDLGTEAKRLNASIERVKETFEASQNLLAIAESTDFAMVAIDMEGVITTWNAAASRIYGYAAREALGRPVTEVTARGQEAEVAEVLRKVRAGEQIGSYEQYRTMKNGERVKMRFYVSPIVDTNGKPVGVSSIGAVAHGE